MRVSVLTPTLPHRRSLLEQASASVAAQTVPVQHLVGADEYRWGPGPVRTNLTMQADPDVEWYLPLDDDDLLDPEAVEILLANTDNADIVYPFCRVEGKPGWCPNRKFSASTLLRFNYIPVTALIRRSLFHQLGGWRPMPAEDWDLWRRALAAGARFKCVDEVLWTYRISKGTRNQWA